MPVPSDLDHLNGGFDDLQNASYEINLALGECHPAAKLVEVMLHLIAAEIDRVRNQLREEGLIN